MNPNLFKGRKIFGMSSFAAHALGAAALGGVGAAVNDQDRMKGAAIGAGVGLVGVSGAKLYSNYGKSLLKHIPAKGTIATVIGGGAAIAAGSAMSTPTYQKAGIAIASQEGDAYDKQTQYENYQYSLSDRTASMNVSGDLVFGLHSLRHG